MNEASSCAEIPHTFVNDPKVYPPIRYGDEPEDWGTASGHRCHDCRCLPNGFHHLGCDVECCPLCLEQAISCDCIREGATD